MITTTYALRRVLRIISFVYYLSAEIVKIYGQSINPEIPYKSLLLLPSDKINVVIRQALDKYGFGKEKESDYNIYKVNAFLKMLVFYDYKLHVL